MIDNDKYKEILETGLLLDHYFLLCNIKKGTKLVETKRIQGFINLLTKKGYLDDGELTEKAIDLISNCNEVEIVVEESRPGKVDFTTWVGDLYRKCQEKVKDRTGDSQYRVSINRKTYPFIPNLIDFTKVIHKVMSLYKLRNDHAKIEKTILSYIDRCADEGSWFPLLQYYIMKNGQSQLVTDMEAPEDGPKENKSSQRFI